MWGVRDSYYRTGEAQVSRLDHGDCRNWHLTHKIDHVGGEKGGAVLLEEGLVGIEHAVEPWKKLLGALKLSVDSAGSCRSDPSATVKGRMQVMLAAGMTALTVVSVEDDGNAVDGSNGADVVRGGNGTSDRSLLLLSRVLDTLAGKVGRTTLAGLETVRMSIRRPCRGIRGLDPT